MHTENNADTKGNCTVGGIECAGQVPRSEMSSESFLTDLLKERRLPPLKNKDLALSRNNAVAEGMDLALSLNVEK